MQVERKTEQGVILFVDVPDDSYNFKVSKGYLWFDNNHFKDCCMPALPEHLDMGDWQLIGLTSDVTEDQAKMMVDSVDGIANSYFLDYSIPKHSSKFKFACISALDSFKSLMQHKKLYEVNPYPKPHADYEYTIDKFDKWQEAQERTSKRVVLFKPNEK